MNFEPSTHRGPWTSILLLIAACWMLTAPAVARALPPLPTLGGGLTDPGFRIDPDPGPVPPDPTPDPVPLPNPTPDKEPYITWRAVGARWIDLTVTSGPGGSTLERSSAGGPYRFVRSLYHNKTIEHRDSGLSQDTQHCYRIVQDGATLTSRCWITGAINTWPPPGTLTGRNVDGDELDDGLETALMKRFAPRFIFHPREKYFPSTVHYYLEGAGLAYGGDLHVNPGDLTVEALLGQTAPIPPLDPLQSTSPYWGWDSEISGYQTYANGTPVKSLFYTVNPDKSVRPGDLENAQIYAHVRRINLETIDVQYWVFYPYNGPMGRANQCDLSVDPATWGDCIEEEANDHAGDLAIHEGDWEHVIVRVKRDNLGFPYMDQVFFSHHGGGHWFTPAPSQMETVERLPGHLENPTPRDEMRYGRPIVYVAHHSHANYPLPGKQHISLIEMEGGPDDHTGWSATQLDAAGPGRLRNVGERGRPMPGMEFMEFSGRWGSDKGVYVEIPFSDDYQLPGVGLSPTTPLYKDGWCRDLTACGAPHPQPGYELEEAWSPDFGSEITAGWWDTEKHPRMLADVNGDGRDDLVGFGEFGVVVSLSTGFDFTPEKIWIADYHHAAGWTRDLYPRFVEDVNGDGMADVVAFQHHGIAVSLSTGTDFEAPRLWQDSFGVDDGWRVDAHLRLVEDVNDDGRADVVGFGNRRTYVALSTGSAFGAVQSWHNGFDVDAGWRIGRHLRVLADVNGDALPDIVGFSDGGAEVALNTGSSFVSHPRTLDNLGYVNGGWRVDQHPRLLGDVDGDGRDDAVGLGTRSVYVGLSHGTGFGDLAVWGDDFTWEDGFVVDADPRFLADVNRDGLDDLVAIKDEGVWVAHSTGQSFAEPRLVGPGFAADQGWGGAEHPRALADPDGDGRLEVVGFGADGVSIGELVRGEPRCGLIGLEVFVALVARRTARRWRTKRDQPGRIPARRESCGSGSPAGGESSRGLRHTKGARSWDPSSSDSGSASCSP